MLEAGAGLAGAAGAGAGAGEGPGHDPTVVFALNKIQTREAKCLRIDNIYQKLYMPGVYNVGGTYDEDIKDFYFFIQTKRIADNHLLSLFIWNKHDTSFTISVSLLNDIQVKNKKTNVSYLTEFTKNYEYINPPEVSCRHIKTFCFTSYDVDSLEGRILIIPLKILDCNKSGVSTEIFQKVKASHNFDALLKDPIFSDFTIESADGTKFQAHTTILSATSDVFKAMLKDDTAESQNKFVKLIDATKEDVECLLQFIYTGSVERVLTRDCRNLLVLADRYDLGGLFMLSQYALRRQLNVDNAIEMAAFADMYNADILRNAAFRFIKLNPDVLTSENWKQVADPEFMNKLFQFLLTNGKHQV